MHLGISKKILFTSILFINFIESSVYADFQKFKNKDNNELNEINTSKENDDLGSKDENQNYDEKTGWWS